MIFEAMADVGVAPARTSMIGDTSFDMDMAAAAGIAGIGVSWGYHPVERLGQARRIVHDYADLRRALEGLWSVTA